MHEFSSLCYDYSARATMFNICENLCGQLHKYHTNVLEGLPRHAGAEKVEKQKEGFPDFPCVAWWR